MVDDLLQVARAAREKAHAPYSNFKVGAAVRAECGQVYGGCNVENAAYPEGICAEASAIAEVLVVGGRDEPGTPCGGCRQKIREFASPDVWVHIASPEGVKMTKTLDALLPQSFGPDNLS